MEIWLYTPKCLSCQGLWVEDPAVHVHTTQGSIQGYYISITIKHSWKKTKVKSHLPWIYSIVWRRVKYKVVPKGDGESEVAVRNSELLPFISWKPKSISRLTVFFFSKWVQATRQLWEMLLLWTPYAEEQKSQRREAKRVRKRKLPKRKGIPRRRNIPKGPQSIKRRRKVKVKLGKGNLHKEPGLC